MTRAPTVPATAAAVPAASETAQNTRTRRSIPGRSPSAPIAPGSVSELLRKMSARTGNARPAASRTPTARAGTELAESKAQDHQRPGGGSRDVRGQARSDQQAVHEQRRRQRHRAPPVLGYLQGDLRPHAKSGSITQSRGGRDCGGGEDPRSTRMQKRRDDAKAPEDEHASGEEADREGCAAAGNRFLPLRTCEPHRRCRPSKGFRVTRRSRARRVAPSWRVQCSARDLGVEVLDAEDLAAGVAVPRQGCVAVDPPTDVTAAVDDPADVAVAAPIPGTVDVRAKPIPSCGRITDARPRGRGKRPPIRIETRCPCASRGRPARSIRRPDRRLVRRLRPEGKAVRIDSRQASRMGAGSGRVDVPAEVKRRRPLRLDGGCHGTSSRYGQEQAAYPGEESAPRARRDDHVAEPDLRHGRLRARAVRQLPGGPRAGAAC